jgi:hypothetical protein
MKDAIARVASRRVRPSARPFARSTTERRGDACAPECEEKKRTHHNLVREWERQNPTLDAHEPRVRPA